MPTSCSIAAAHSSSCSPGWARTGRRRERVVHLQRQPRDVLGVGQVGLVLDRQVAHGGLADVGNSGSSSPSSVSARKMPSRRPASVASMPANAALAEDRLQRDRRGQDDVAAARLDPGHRAPLGAGSAASVSTSSASAAGVSTKPWTPMSRARLAARCAAAARLRTAPPVPTSRPPASQTSPRPRAPRARGHAAAAGPSSWPVRSPAGGTRSCARRRAGTSAVVGVAVPDLDQLHAAAAEVEHDAVGERGGVDGGDVAVVRLVLGGEHLDREPVASSARRRNSA